jgi:hypothetical protein
MTTNRPSPEGSWDYEEFEIYDQQPNGILAKLFGVMAFFLGGRIGDKPSRQDRAGCSLRYKRGPLGSE